MHYKYLGTLNLKSLVYDLEIEVKDINKFDVLDFDTFFFYKCMPHIHDIFE